MGHVKRDVCSLLQAQLRVKVEQDHHHQQDGLKGKNARLSCGSKPSCDARCSPCAQTLRAQHRTVRSTRGFELAIGTHVCIELSHPCLRVKNGQNAAWAQANSVRHPNRSARMLFYNTCLSSCLRKSQLLLVRRTLPFSFTFACLVILSLAFGSTGVDFRPLSDSSVAWQKQRVLELHHALGGLLTGLLVCTHALLSVNPAWSVDMLPQEPAQLVRMRRTFADHTPNSCFP